MIEKRNIVQAMDGRANTPYNEPTSNFREVRTRKSVIAFFLGMAIIAASIVFGHRYVIFPIFALAFFVTFIWRNTFRPWIFLVSILASNPVSLTRQAVQPNLIFAFLFLLFNFRYLFRLPKWIYVMAGLVLFGFVTSSVNWLSADLVRNLLQQGAFAYTYILGPFLLLPVVYSRMGESRDNVANLQGLLFCLIVPSTVILLMAKVMGSPYWYGGDTDQAFLFYRLGATSVTFLRTQVGFIFAALICASAAIVVSQVRGLYRLLAGACLVSNVALLLITGSFGSMIASLCGLAAMFYAQLRTVKITRVLTSIAVIVCILVLIWSLSPGKVKNYLGKHYQERVSAGTKQDRFTLWGHAVNQILHQPGGVGWTLSVGDKQKSNMHNEYLAYAVSYGIIGGFAYASLIAGLMIYFLQRRKKGSRDQYALAIHLAGLGVVVAFAVNSMTDHVTPCRWYFITIWSIIWYSYFCSRAPQVKTVPNAISSVRLQTGISRRTAF